MRLVFNRDILLTALEKVCSIASQKNGFAILSYFLVDVKSGKCSFTSTDMTDSMRLVVDAEASEDGTFLLKGKETLDIVKGLPKGDIQLDIDRETIRIKSGKFKANMNTADVSEYPNVALADIESGLRFKSSELKGALNQVSQFVATNDSRTAFCGVHLGYRNNEENASSVVTLVSTDGHRLGKSELFADTVGEEVPNPDGYIISTKAVQLLSKFFSDENTVLFSVKKISDSTGSDSKAIFKGEKITIVTSLIAGTYPDFSKVIPDDTDKNIVVDKNILIASLRRSSLFNPKHLTARLEFSEGNINICSSGQMGNMSDDVECKYNGENVVIGVNSKYLEQSLSIVDDQFAVISVVDQDSPIRVMSETDFDANNFGTLSVVMPMQF